jgi:hypothetical protein
MKKVKPQAKDKTKPNDIKVKKQKIIELYKLTFGNVTKSCEALHISRTTFYQWLKDDVDFKAEIENTSPDDLIVDFAEDALIGRIRAGDTTAIIFTLKTKGKKRGYVEKQEIGITPENSTKPIIVFGDEEDEDKS